MGEALAFPPVTVGAARERLMSGNFEFIGGHYLRQITADAVEIGVLATGRVRKIPAKTVVIAGFNVPQRELFESLQMRGIKAHLIGEALGQNGIMPAIHSAAALMRTI